MYYKSISPLLGGNGHFLSSNKAGETNITALVDPERVWKRNRNKEEEKRKQRRLKDVKYWQI